MITKIFWQFLKWVTPDLRRRWDKDGEEAYEYNWFHSVANWWPFWKPKKIMALRSGISRRKYPWLRMWNKKQRKKDGLTKLPMRYVRDHVLVKRSEGGSWVRL